MRQADSTKGEEGVVGKNKRGGEREARARVRKPGHRGRGALESGAPPVSRCARAGLTGTGAGEDWLGVGMGVIAVALCGSLLLTRWWGGPLCRRAVQGLPSGLRCWKAQPCSRNVHSTLQNRGRRFSKRAVLPGEVIKCALIDISCVGLKPTLWSLDCMPETLTAGREWRVRGGGRQNAGSGLGALSGPSKLARRCVS